MEKEYLKITPGLVAKKLGLNVLECQHSTGSVTKRDEDNAKLVVKDLEVTEDGFLRIEFKYIYI